MATVVPRSYITKAEVTNSTNSRRTISLVNKEIRVYSINGFFFVYTTP